MASEVAEFASDNADAMEAFKSVDEYNPKVVGLD